MKPHLTTDWARPSTSRFTELSSVHRWFQSDIRLGIFHYNRPVNDAMTGVFDIAAGTLTLFDGSQIHLGAGTLRLISDPRQPLLGWELEFAGVVDPELERLGMLTHMPQAITLSDTDGRWWHGRALASTRGAAVTLIGYGPLERQPLK